LIHQPLLALLAPEQFGWRMDSRFVVIAVGLARLAVVVAIGFGFYLLLERPFILQRKPGERLFNWIPRRNDPIAAQPLQPKP
jgi:peptidoglycan/LPS O-acetylase OafA/YrhL